MLKALLEKCNNINQGHDYNSLLKKTVEEIVSLQEGAAPEFDAKVFNLQTEILNRNEGRPNFAYADAIDQLKKIQKTDSKALLNVGLK